MEGEWRVESGGGVLSSKYIYIIYINRYLYYIHMYTEYVNKYICGYVGQ